MVLTVLGTMSLFGAAEPTVKTDVPLLLPPPPTKTVKVKPEVLNQHPRLYFTAKDIEALSRKLTGPEMAPMWTAYLQRVTEIANTPPPENPPVTEDPFRGFGDRLPKLAFAWVITRDPVFLNATKSWMEAVVRYPSWAGDGDLGAAHCCFGLAVAYDWLYADLTPAERARIETALQRHGQLLLNRALERPGKWWGWAYFQNHSWIDYTGVAAVAMATYESDPARMQAWLDHTRSQFEITYRYLGIDGGYHEGAGYLRYGTLWLLNYIEALRSISGEDLSNMPYLQKVTRHLLDTTMPDRRNLVHFNDCPAEAWGASFDEPILPWLAAHQENGRAEWLRQVNRAACGKVAYDSPFGLLWFDPTIKAQAPDDLPTLGIYPDLGIVVSRTGWGEDAAVMAFHCGPPGGHSLLANWKLFPSPAEDGMFGHSHPDANSFLFWSRGQWRIALPAQYPHDKMTSHANTWLVGGMGQRGEAEWMKTDSYVAATKQPHLVRVASTKECDYVVGEAAPAYVYSAHLVSFRRHLLFVKKPSPYIIVYDRLCAQEPQEWASYWHAFGGFEAQPSGEFQIQGAFPTFAGEKPRTPPATLLTPTFGQFLSPGKIAVGTHPLTILGHPNKKPIQQGYELVCKQPASATTWLVTVIGEEKKQAVLSGKDGAPQIKIKEDQIAWDAEGNVSFNGKVITGNLLPSSAGK